MMFIKSHVPSGDVAEKKILSLKRNEIDDKTQ